MDGRNEIEKLHLVSGKQIHKCIYQYMYLQEFSKNKQMRAWVSEYF